MNGQHNNEEMPMKKNKYYVVWKGHVPGVYDTWEKCERAVKGFGGAKYMSFKTLKEAQEAFAKGCGVPRRSADKRTVQQHTPTYTPANLPAAAINEAIAVDAACSGNPGKMEYRGVYLRTGKEIFHYGPVYGTNNIGEFLAIVHGLALMKQRGLDDMPLYSDSVNAQLWVKGKKCKTTLKRNAKSEALFQLIERAENWLRNNAYRNPILKWPTGEWGEIPADFGRK